MSTIDIRRPRRATGPAMPDGELALQEPPELPERKPPSFARMFMMLPMLIGMSVGALVAFRPGGSAVNALGPSMMGLSMVGMMAVGVLGGGGDRKQQLNGRRRDYLRYLAQTRRKVRAVADQQRVAQAFRHPEPHALLAFARSQRLWERRHDDDDFAAIRLAVGRQRLRVKLNPPDTKPVEDLEPLSAIALRRFLEAHHEVDELAMAVSLRSFSALLLRGHGDSVDALGRAIIAQLATHHAPGDARIVVCATPDRRAYWEWTKWLPHMSHPTERDAIGPLRCFAGTIDEVQLLAGGDELNERPHFAPNAGVESDDPFVLVVLDGVEVPAASRFATRGFADLCVLDVGGTLVPQRGARYLELDVQPDEVSVVTGADASRTIGSPDQMTPTTALALARTIAPCRIPIGAVDSSAPLVTDIELTALLGITDARTFDPMALWAERPSWAHLRVPIGVAADGTPLELDLKEAAQGGSGPHGVLIGATGSGKSELLRTLVMSLACTHSSESLNFVLVDFKGGATFLGLEDLPHTSAVITNLADELVLVDRMQDAIHGELVRRQEVLRAAGHASRHDYEKARQRGAALDPLPSLVLIIDEFSELLAAKREFSELFVMVGRVGRSLGVHLLLASQRLDEGRISELSSHLSYRIGLKTFSAAESRSVLGVTDAYDTVLPPGGGFVKSDHGDPQRFKAAYISAPLRTSARPDPLPTSPTESRVEVLPFGPDVVVPSEPIVAPEHGDDSHPAGGGLEGPDDSHADGDSDADDDAPTIMHTLAARLEGVGPDAHRLWLPPLRRAPSVDTLIGAPDAGALGRPPIDRSAFGSLRVPVGFVDRPFEQRWDYLVADLAGGGGHVAIAGGQQSGKSTLVKTLVTALAMTHTPQEVQFYCLDFGGGSLASIAGLPHVGTVTGRLDGERIERTVAEMTRLMSSRESRFTQDGIDSIAEYRRRRADGEFASDGYGTDVFLIVDGWFTLRNEFDHLESEIQDLVTRGLAFGIHVVVSTARWADTRPWLRDNLGTRFELHLGDPIDSQINARQASTVPDVPGRGLHHDGAHFLAGLPRIDGSAETSDIATATRAVGELLTAVWGDQRAPRIDLVPKVLPPTSLPVAEGDDRRESNLRVPLGMTADDLDVLWHDFGVHPHLTVVGDNESGKTNVLQTVADAVVGQLSPSAGQMLICDYRRHLYSTVPEANRLAFATSGAALKEMLDDLVTALSSRVPDHEIAPDRLPLRDWWSGKKLFVLIDDYDLVASGVDTPLRGLVELLPAGADIGLHLVVARSAAGAGRAMMGDPVLRRMNELGTPTLLLSCPRDEGHFGPVRAEALPPGRARYVTRRTARPVQTVFVGETGRPSSKEPQRS